MSKFFEDFTQELDSDNAADAKTFLEASVVFLETKQDAKSELVAEVYSVAIDALAKRIMKYAKVARKDDALLFECPACAAVLDNTRHRFCEKCGQSIKFPKALQSNGE